jgi:hypothetical protein
LFVQPSARDAPRLLGVDLRVPDATRPAADRVLTPSGASIVKERKKGKRAGGARRAGDF